MKRFPVYTFFLSAFLLLAFSPEADLNDAETLKWETLAKVEWIWDDNFYRVEFNEEQQALDGKELIVEGFMFPLEYSRKHTTFLVSSAPMSDCFFCGPGEAESMVYVKTETPVEYSYSKMAVKGTFKLVSDASMGIIYELEGAEVISQ